MLEDWTIYSWYCPNCRNEVAGLKNSKNQIRVKCKTCGSEMVRTILSAQSRNEKSIGISTVRRSTTLFHRSLVRDAGRTRAFTIPWILT